MTVHVFDACLAALALYLVGHLAWRRRIPLPPGPPGWPLIDNLLDFLSHAPYKTLGPMSERYGKSIRASPKACNTSLTFNQVLSYPLKCWVRDTLF